MTINEKTNKFKYIKIKPDSVLFEKKNTKNRKDHYEQSQNKFKTWGEKPHNSFHIWLNFLMQYEVLEEKRHPHRKMWNRIWTKRSQINTWALRHIEDTQPHS